MCIGGNGRVKWYRCSVDWGKGSIEKGKRVGVELGFKGKLWWLRGIMDGAFIYLYDVYVNGRVRECYCFCGF